MKPIMRVLLILVAFCAAALAQEPRRQATIQEYLMWLAGGPNLSSPSFYYGSVMAPRSWLARHCYTANDMVTGPALEQAAQAALDDLSRGISTRCVAPAWPK